MRRKATTRARNASAACARILDASQTSRKAQPSTALHTAGLAWRDTNAAALTPSSFANKFPEPRHLTVKLLHRLDEHPDELGVVDP